MVWIAAGTIVIIVVVTMVTAPDRVINYIVKEGIDGHRRRAGSYQ